MRKMIACFTLLASSAYAVDPGASAPLRGYTPEHSATEVQWEQKFRAMPDPARLRGEHEAADGEAASRGVTVRTRTTRSGCWRS